MADNPPITREVPETVTVDTGADPETIGNLNESFADFWAGEDAKESTAPAAPEAPKDGAAQETRVEATPPAEKAPAKPKEEAKPAKPPAPVLIDSDDDIDGIEMTPNAQPQVIDDFKKIKDLWKADRAKIRAESQRASQLEQQLAEARRNAWTPEAKADYEHAAGIRRRFDFASDPEFQEKHQRPIHERYHEILDEAVGMLPDRNAAAEWAAHMKQNYGPDSLNKGWWQSSVLSKVPDPMDRDSLQASVNELLRMQRTRDTELNRRTSDKSAFDQWVQEKTQTTAQRVQEEIMAEIGTQEQRIAEYLPRNIEEAKTKEEREAISAHNERFEKLNEYFKGVVHDISKNGPRAWVRAGVEATRSLILEQEYKAMEEELKSTKSERDKYKTELDKINGARRRLATTPAAPGAPRKDSGMSIRNLDVRKSFEDFDWGDNNK